MATKRSREKGDHLSTQEEKKEEKIARETVSNWETHAEPRAGINARVLTHMRLQKNEPY